MTFSQRHYATRKLFTIRSVGFTHGYLQVVPLALPEEAFFRCSDVVMLWSFGFGDSFVIRISSLVNIPKTWRNLHLRSTIFYCSGVGLGGY